MTIQFERVYKRFDREWIVKDFSYAFAAGETYGIRGPNGSGKSTLLRLISGHLSASKGRIGFQHEERPIPASALYPYFGICAPYIDPLEELTLAEAIQFHFRFKRLRPGIIAGLSLIKQSDIQQLCSLFQLEGHHNRSISSFSSGMRQRVNLGLAICSNTPLLLLDEPTVTLDERGKEWYQEILSTNLQDRLVIIASNEADDLRQCTTILQL